MYVHNLYVDLHVEVSVVGSLAFHYVGSGD